MPVRTESMVTAEKTISKHSLQNDECHMMCIGMPYMFRDSG
jgi:hypothetical protein